MLDLKKNWLSKLLNRKLRSFLGKQCFLRWLMFEFAPNLPSLSEATEKSEAIGAIFLHFRVRSCMVSLGKMDNFYLWDYDLPFIFHSGGPGRKIMGYYLLPPSKSSPHERGDSFGFK